MGYRSFSANAGFYLDYYIKKFLNKALHHRTGKQKRTAQCYFLDSPAASDACKGIRFQRTGWGLHSKLIQLNEMKGDL